MGGQEKLTLSINGKQRGRPGAQPIMRSPIKDFVPGSWGTGANTQQDDHFSPVMLLADRILVASYVFLLPFASQMKPLQELGFTGADSTWYIKGILHHLKIRIDRLFPAKAFHSIAETENIAIFFWIRPSLSQETIFLPFELEIVVLQLRSQMGHLQTCQQSD